MAQMETRVVRDVTGKSFDIFILKNLDYLFDEYSNIRETKYLLDFSMLKTQRTFNPKFIIRDMLITYMRNVINIYHQPDLLQNFIFTFHEEDENVCTFIFSNNKMFKDDITTICFLWCIINTFKSDAIILSEIVQILKSVMFNKYGICVETEAGNADPKKITLDDTALAFPSITWNIIYDLEWKPASFTSLSDFDIPTMMFVPHISRLLPKLKEPPLAILMVQILRKIKSDFPETYGDSLLQTIDYYIKSELSYKYKRFPERLKLELCEKWQIIILENGIYKYNSNFEAHRQKAKDIIAKMKPDDPNLERILSGI